MRLYFDGDTQTFSRFQPQVDTPKPKQEPKQIGFWDGFQVLPEEEDAPFPEDKQ